jgi:hypothetical protein
MDRSGRRRHRRFDVEDLKGSFVVRVEIAVTNLSVAGMAIDTRNTLVVGRRYTFRIMENGSPVDVSGTVMWCVLGSATPAAGGDVIPTFRAGIRFEDVFDQQTLKLQRLIERSGVLDAGDQVSGRFRPDVPATVDVGSCGLFEVKKISRSGMLADSDWKPRPNELVPFEITLGDDLLTGHGRIAYIEGYEADDGGQRYHLGVEFDRLPAEASALLARFIGELVSLQEHEETA